MIISSKLRFYFLVNLINSLLRFTKTPIELYIFFKINHRIINIKMFELIHKNKLNVLLRL